MESDSEVTFKNNAERQRYVAVSNERSVAFSEYELAPGRIVFTHTVVRPEYEGRGIGSGLARFAIRDAQSQGLRITPVCPFVRAYLRRHPEYESIVDYPVSSH